MKKYLFLALLILSFLSLTLSVKADPFQWSFELLPADGNISGPPGSTIGWGYTISNLDDTDWLVLTGITADPMESNFGNLDSSIFDFPILAPGVTLSASYDGTIGLYELSWDIVAPIDFFNRGTFILSAEWWNGDPLNGGMGIEPAEDKNQPYSATVLAAVPEPTTLLLLSSGVIFLLGFRKRFCSKRGFEVTHA